MPARTVYIDSRYADIGAHGAPYVSIVWYVSDGIKPVSLSPYQPIPVVLLAPALDM